MDKKTLFALTAKIFNTLKGIGIKPKLGVTTGVKRLPGSRNSFNTDLSTLGEGNAESLKRLIANDADFLPQATADEIVQYSNNLEYLKSTYPDTFAKAQVVTESKTGIKTLVNDVDEKIKRPTKEEYEEYSQILDDSENFVVQGNETFEELDALVKKQKDYEDFMYTQYKRGKLDPVAGEKTQDRMNFLRKKAEEAEMTGDRRLFSINEIKELEDLEKTFSPMGTSNKINISDPKTAESFTEFAKQNDPEGFKKIQKIVDDINNKNTLENFDVKDREPNAKGGSVGNLTYKKMFGDLDKTLGKGLGTMFKKRKR
jgi:cell division protein ZapA (FtsZ GTPase activity inhibitor)